MLQASMKQLSSAIQNLVESEDSAHAERWYWACVKLINPDQAIDSTSVDAALVQRKRHVLIHGFGRAKGLIDAALEWPEPRIGRYSEGELAEVRGALWRYVMAYCGWELIAKSVHWHETAVRDAIHTAFDTMLSAEGCLKPPFATQNEAPLNLQQWFDNDASNERNLPAFLGLNNRLKSFPRWLVSENTSLTAQRVLAATRTPLLTAHSHPQKLLTGDYVTSTKEPPRD
jgi:hypothetical protein